MRHAGQAREAGTLLKERRLQLELSQDDVAAAAGLTNRQYLYMIESGRVDPSRSRWIGAIAQVLKFTPEEQRALFGVRALERPSKQAAHEPGEAAGLAELLEPQSLSAASRVGLVGRACYAWDGEVLLVDHDRRELAPRGMYLVLTEKLQGCPVLQSGDS